MTANFSKHAPFNGPHDTISLWSGALYESLTFSFCLPSSLYYYYYSMPLVRIFIFSLFHRWSVRLRERKPTALQQHQEQIDTLHASGVMRIR